MKMMLGESVTSGFSIVFALVLCSAARAQTAEGPQKNPAVEDDVASEVLVVGQRLGGNLKEVPRSVTVIDAAELEIQRTATRDLGDILGRVVPGIGPSVEGRSNGAGQSTIRGRRLQLVIDGVVQNNTLLDFNQELGTLSPDLVERIEVIRGGTAIYGFGATGGIINVTTKRPQAGPPRFTTRIASSFQPDEFDDSLSYPIYQDAAFSVGRFDARVIGSYVRRENRFDSDGRRIPTPTSGSIDNTHEYTFDTALGYAIDEDQRLELQVVYSEREEHDRWIGVGNAVSETLPSPTQVGPGIFDLTAFARTQDAPPVLFRTKQGRISYDNAAILGSKLNLIAYGQEKFNRTATQLVQLTPPVPAAQRPLLRNFGSQRQVGTRLTIDTPLAFLEERSNVVWGLDYEWQKYEQPNNVPGIDPNTPPTTQNAYAGYAQLVYHPVSALTLSTGVRYEKIVAQIDDFRVSRLINSPSAGNLVQGGELSFDRVIPNLGMVYEFSPEVAVFASYAQGFSIGELLRPIRGTTAPSVEATVDLKPLVVDNYELGVRGDIGRASYTLAGFYSTSELGAVFILNPLTGNNRVERAPERVWGVEATLDLDLTDRWKFGGSLAHQEGERELQGVWSPLPGNRIAPLKIHAYVDGALAERLRVRLQALYGGSRDEFPGSTVQNEGDVGSVSLLDGSLIAGIGPGDLTIGVQNLLAKQYVPQAIQALNSATDYYSGQGRTVTLGYVVHY